MPLSIMSNYVQSTDELKGKPAARVADVLEQLIDARGEPVEWEVLCVGAGIEYPAQMLPAMHALELVGAVVRFETVGKRELAYALADEVTIVEE